MSEPAAPATARRLTVVGAAAMATGVALGAFGAHGLRRVLPADRLAVYHTGAEYHLAHALGILLVAALAGRAMPERHAGWAGGLLAVGIVLFSGSLYSLAATGVAWLGAVTPLGGVCFLAGWTVVAAGALRANRHRL